MWHVHGPLASTRSFRLLNHFLKNNIIYDSDQVNILSDRLVPFKKTKLYSKREMKREERNDTKLYYIVLYVWF